MPYPLSDDDDDDGDDDDDDDDGDDDDDDGGQEAHLEAQHQEEPQEAQHQDEQDSLARKRIRTVEHTHGNWATLVYVQRIELDGV